MSFSDSDLEDAEIYRQVVAQDGHHIIERPPSKHQKLGRFTLLCLPLNRTIGSGIFVAPSLVLKATGSVGSALLLWPVSGLIVGTGLLVWLEMGLSTPRNVPQGLQQMVAIMSNGGEKNFLEYMYPYLVTTCMFGLAFILLGNLAGNAIAFGKYVMIAAGNPRPPQGWVLGIAIAALTSACGIHIASRRGGIFLNNCFAVIKVSLLVVMIILGSVHAAGHDFGGHTQQRNKALSNFNPAESFSGTATNVASFSNAMLFVFFAYSGYEQPFYAMAEFRQPRKRFPKYTSIAMIITIVLFTLINVIFFCVVPKDQALTSSSDITTLFFENMFGSQAAPRAMAALVAVCIYGNLVVMTFTASRVKQEIAKEGILPWSLFFGRSKTTFLARKWEQYRQRSRNLPERLEAGLERTPIPALFLQWLSSMVLIAVTSFLTTDQAYTVLTGLYTYVLVALVGFFVSVGLVLLYMRPSADWKNVRDFSPFPYPFHAMIYGATCGFLLFSSLAPDEGKSSYSQQHIPSWLIPAIGLTSPFWGLTLYGGIKLREWWSKRVFTRTRRQQVEEDPDDPGRYIMVSEDIRAGFLVTEPEEGGAHLERFKIRPK